MPSRIAKGGVDDVKRCTVGKISTSSVEDIVRVVLLFVAATADDEATE